MGEEAEMLGSWKWPIGLLAAALATPWSLFPPRYYIVFLPAMQLHQKAAPKEGLLLKAKASANGHSTLTWLY